MDLARADPPDMVMKRIVEEGAEHLAHILLHDVERSIARVFPLLSREEM